MGSLLAEVGEEAALQEPVQAIIEQAAKRSIDEGVDFLPALMEAAKQYPEILKEVGPTTAASTAITSLLTGGLAGAANRKIAQAEQKDAQRIQKQDALYDRVQDMKVGDEHAAIMEELREDLTEAEREELGGISVKARGGVGGETVTPEEMRRANEIAARGYERKELKAQKAQVEALAEDLEQTGDPQFATILRESAAALDEQLADVERKASEADAIRSDSKRSEAGEDESAPAYDKERTDQLRDEARQDIARDAEAEGLDEAQVNERVSALDLLYPHPEAPEAELTGEAKKGHENDTLKALERARKRGQERRAKALEAGDEKEVQRMDRHLAYLDERERQIRGEAQESEGAQEADSKWSLSKGYTVEGAPEGTQTLKGTKQHQFVLRDGNKDWGHVTEELTHGDPDIPVGPVRVQVGQRRWGLRHVKHDHAREALASYDSVEDFIAHIMDDKNDIIPLGEDERGRKSEFLVVMKAGSPRHDAAVIVWNEDGGFYTLKSAYSPKTSHIGKRKSLSSGSPLPTSGPAPTPIQPDTATSSIETTPDGSLGDRQHYGDSDTGQIIPRDGGTTQEETDRAAASSSTSETRPAPSGPEGAMPPSGGSVSQQAPQTQERRDPRNVPITTPRTSKAKRARIRERLRRQAIDAGLEPEKADATAELGVRMLNRLAQLTGTDIDEIDKSMGPEIVKGTSVPSTGDESYEQIGRGQAQTRTANFKRTFGNWSYDPDAKVNVTSISGTELTVLGLDLKKANALKKWLAERYVGQTVEIESDGSIIGFSKENIGAALKKRGEAQRQAYAALDDLIRNAVYFDFEEADGQVKHRNLRGQDVYYSALRIGDKLYSVRFKFDVLKKSLERTYKDHKVTEIDVSPLVSHRHGQEKTQGGTYARTGDTTVTLSDLTGGVKPKPATKAVDANGEPLVVWHSGTFGARHGETVARGPMHFGTREAAMQRIGAKAIDDAIQSIETWEEDDGTWSASVEGDVVAEGLSSEEEAYDEAASIARTMEIDYLYDEADEAEAVFLNIRNPKRVRDAGAEWGPIIEAAKAEGHDGIVYRNEFEDRGSDSFIAFYPEQIKSATDNRGTFDAGDADIYHQNATAEQRLAAAEKAWGRAVDGVLNGTISGREHIKVMETPTVFTLAGAKRLPIYIDAGKISRILSKHDLGMTADILKQMPRAMADPIAIFDSKPYPSKRIVVMTGVKDAKGSTVIVPVELGRKQHAYYVNKISSIYGKDSDAWFVNQAKAGRTLYINRQKSSQWSNQTGLQLPVGTTSGNGQRIADEQDLVKARAGTGHYQRLGERGAQALDAADAGRAPMLADPGAIVPRQRVDGLHVSQGQVAPRHAERELAVLMSPLDVPVDQPAHGEGGAERRPRRVRQPVGDDVHHIAGEILARVAPVLECGSTRGALGSACADVFRRSGGDIRCPCRSDWTSCSPCSSPVWTGWLWSWRIRGRASTSCSGPSTARGCSARRTCSSPSERNTASSTSWGC